MLWLLALACQPDAPPPAAPAEGPRPPDVLLITVDTLRADRVGAYGDPLARTPNLDRLAAEGVLFREAHATVPLTLPSHASILTGLYPAHHGLRDNAGFRLAHEVDTLAEALSARGYQTAAFVSAFVLDGAWGLDQGFATYRDPFHPEDVTRVGAFGEVELPGAEVVNAAVAWWREAGPAPDEVTLGKASTQPRAPRFAWVHLYDPHTPWQPHAGWEGDPYRGEVAYADSLLGRLLQEVGSDTLVIATSDHGEGLWDHGEREHGVLVSRSATRVPLLVRPPGGLSGRALVTPRTGFAVPTVRPDGADPTLDLEPVPDAPVAARVVEAPVSGVDLAPTIADYAGATLRADGRSLRPALEGAAGPAAPVYAESYFALFHYGWAGLRMAQDQAARVELGARATVVDWPADPLGAHAAPLEPGAHADLVAFADLQRGDAVPAPGPIDATTAAALAALGYTTAPPPPDPADTPDPRDRIAVLGELHAAEALPDHAATVAALRDLVTREPDMVDARISLSLALAETGDPRGALEQTLLVLDRRPEHPTALSNAAVLARSLGDGDRALELARRMQALNPQDARGYRIEAAVWVDREEAAEVLRICRAGLAVAPEDPNLHYLLALAELQTGDPTAAVAHLEAAREHGTHASDVSLWLGYAHEKAGNTDEALRHYKDASLSMPGDPRPSAMAGVMLYRAQRCEDALPFLVNVARRGGGSDPLIQEALRACSPR